MLTCSGKFRFISKNYVQNDLVRMHQKRRRLGERQRERVHDVSDYTVPCLLLVNILYLCHFIIVPFFNCCFCLVKLY